MKRLRAASLLLTGVLFGPLPGLAAAQQTDVMAERLRQEAPKVFLDCLWLTATGN